MYIYIIYIRHDKTYTQTLTKSNKIKQLVSQVLHIRKKITRLRK